MRLGSLALLLAAAVAASPAGAFERTGSVVADALLRTLEASGYQSATVGSVGREDGDTVLRDVTAVTAADGRSLAIDRVVIENGFVNADNDLVAQSVVYEDAAVEAGDGGTSTVERVTIDGVRFSGDGGEGLAALLGSFDTISISGVEAAASGGDVVEVAAISAAVGERDPEAGFGGRIAVTGLSFDAALWEEPLAARLQAFGYDRLSLDLVLAGRWDAETGRADVRELRIAGKDAGALTMSAEASGLTPAAIAATRQALEDIPALLERLQTISFSSLTVAYDDAGLAERLLARTAEEADITREALAEGLAATAGNLVAALQNPEFAARVTEALQTFLTDPGALTVSANPPQPVSAAQVLAAAVVNPALLPDLLGLSVSAAP